MKKVIYYLIVVCSFNLLLVNCKSEGSKGNDYAELKEGFLNPPQIARPKVYWWCLNGYIDTIKAKEEFQAMKDAGIAGFDLFEIGAPRGNTVIPAGPAFLSDESLAIIRFAATEAKKLGLEMGLNIASSWNAGGAWTLPKDAGKSLYLARLNVKGGSEVSINVPFPEISFPKSALIGGTGKPMIPFRDNGRPEYYEDIAILAVPSGIKSDLDTSKVINVTQYFDPATDMLKWNVPSGDWEIQRYVCSNSGQQLVLPSPYSAGLTIDHFDSTAVRTHLMYIINKLKPVLGDFRNTALNNFYLASYEARGFVWTSTLAKKFRELHGYDIYKFLPAFFDKELLTKELADRAQIDFRKTLSELMINNLFKNGKEICNRYGLKINCEAGGPGFPLYNGPAEPLKALGSLDTPRGEFWIGHGRYYIDQNVEDTTRKDSIDILRVVKEVAAASHIYQKGIVEEEAFTSFQHWQEGPGDMKFYGDRAFGEGMNRVVFHGFTHNPPMFGYPGIVYHAGTHYNNKRVWWKKIKPFNDYLARNSYIFQNTKFFADVLWYYGDKIPNSTAPKNTHFTAGPGYDYEVVNTEILLNGVTVKDGKIHLSNGAVFSMLALDREEEINPSVLVKLKELASQGAVIIGPKPKRVPDLNNQPISGKEGEELVNTLWVAVSDPTQIKLNEKGKIYSGIKPVEMLKVLNVTPDFNYRDRESFLIDYIHYNKNDLDFYFVINPTDQWITRECGFRVGSKVPEIWNPVTGEIIPITIYNQQDNYIKMPVTLAPFESNLVVFKSGNPSPAYQGFNGNEQDPPLIQFTKEGVVFLKEGNYSLKNNASVENKIRVRPIEGDWNLSFTKGWGAPDSVILPQLISWTEHENPGVKYYSGTGSYTKSFEYKKDAGQDERIWLDLGEISKVGEAWLNDKPLGILWTRPYRYDVTDLIKDGPNTLKIEIANVWSNRLTGDALTGEKFTQSNVSQTIVVGESNRRFSWADVPLIKSGLLGPVTLQTVKVIK